MKAYSVFSVFGWPITLCLHHETRYIVIYVTYTLADLEGRGVREFLLVSC